MCHIDWLFNVMIISWDVSHRLFNVWPDRSDYAVNTDLWNEKFSCLIVSLRLNGLTEHVTIVHSVMKSEVWRNVWFQLFVFNFEMSDCTIIVCCCGISWSWKMWLRSVWTIVKSEQNQLNGIQVECVSELIFIVMCCTCLHPLSSLSVCQLSVSVFQSPNVIYCVN